jgi:hypothetical protein
MHRQWVSTGYGKGASSNGRVPINERPNSMNSCPRLRRSGSTDGCLARFDNG